MRIQKLTAIALAALPFVTPSAVAQVAITRAPRPAVAAPIEPTPATLAQIFERLPETEQQALMSLAAQEELHDMEFSPVTAEALGQFGDGDIEAVSLIVLMAAARDADDDIRRVMEEMSASQGCSSERGAIVASPATPVATAEAGAPTIHRPVLTAPSAARVSEPALVAQSSSPRCESEVGFDLRQTRLQAAMDRSKRAHEILSRILRGQNEDQGEIVQSVR
ncbi:MAG: hypothetical protein ABL889_22090 [Terricaulis sp.]